MKLGSRWRIGDGKSVLIHCNKWLPEVHFSRVISPLRNFPSNTHVYALIDEDKSCWIENRIYSEFLPHEAKSILSLPLSSNGLKVDTVIWIGTKNGHYSTKSAYRFPSDEESVAAPGPSDPTEHKQFWQEIWSLNVPNKIHHFIWRACNESFPTKQNLYRQKVALNGECCYYEDEDIIYALWGC